MKILLVAMPDAANNFQRIITVPNLGLCTIAAQLKDHQVKVVDLVLVHRRIRRWLVDFLGKFRPDLIGISCMSFQYDSALKVVAICRACLPGARTVLGGYHATLEYASIARSGAPLDFLIRGEGELAFRGLVEALERGGGFDAVPGLSWQSEGEFVHNPTGGLLDLGLLPLPDRQARVLGHFTYFGRTMDCLETSRGCTSPCSFCSITAMYGSSFRCHAIGRVLADLEELQRRGTETVLLVDDNITLDPVRFRKLAEAIAESGLTGMEYLVQASVAGIVADPGLIPAMARANFRLVFLGIESVQARNLELFRKGDILAKTEQAVRLLRQNRIAVMGGFIIGNPDDTGEDIREVYRTIRRLRIDLPYVQCVTPYPGTRIRNVLLREGLVTNPADLSRYTGFICNVRTRHLTRGQLNRTMNWENIKIFFDPTRYRDNHFVRRGQKGTMKVVLNNLELVRGWFTGDQFRSRHTF
ncbi:B12-binding domain-containing radical SAM protein [Geobacter sp. SVR]|uniref:B12-binding domain-containing radical SAM protein n=1 Tax=Geobacter sp. SVR TaxID=2495594 RepID=UPI00143F0411|nr:radical SAM protein [Geobacter sp. SVR]BCS53576.1 B12-binding domain-containing radical SAM protein [Geobacter sp. SVR]GCF84227.1 B12-binding domain-containing radical SAM protein [Geobacter sp. SVR]